MKKVITMVALAAICSGSVFAGIPVKTSHSVTATDTTKKKVKVKKDGEKKKVKMKKDTTAKM